MVILIASDVQYEFLEFIIRIHISLNTVKLIYKKNSVRKRSYIQIRKNIKWSIFSEAKHF